MQCLESLPKKVGVSENQPYLLPCAFQQISAQSDVPDRRHSRLGERLNPNGLSCFDSELLTSGQINKQTEILKLESSRSRALQKIFVCGTPK